MPALTLCGPSTLPDQGLIHPLALGHCWSLSLLHGQEGRLDKWRRSCFRSDKALEPAGYSWKEINQKWWRVNFMSITVHTGHNKRHLSCSSTLILPCRTYAWCPSCPAVQDLENIQDLLHTNWKSDDKAPLYQLRIWWAWPIELPELSY